MLEHFNSLHSFQIYCTIIVVGIASFGAVQYLKYDLPQGKDKLKKSILFLVGLYGIPLLFNFIRDSLS